MGTKLASDQVDSLVSAANVRDFGAVGDGSTDDTVAIQAALDSGSGSVYVPESSTAYNHTGVTVPEGVKFYGEGFASNLHNTGTGVSCAIDGTAGNFHTDSRVTGIRFTGTSSASDGITLIGTSRGTEVDHCWVHEHGGDGISLQNATGSVIYKNDIKENTGAGVTITEHATIGVSCAANSILYNYITGNDGGGVNLVATTSSSKVFSNIIMGGAIESNNVAATSGVGITIDGAQHTTVRNVTMESAFDQNIALVNTSGYKANETLIDDIKFSDSAAPTQSNDILINGADRTTISNCTFVGSLSTPVREQSGDVVTYLNNKNLDADSSTAVTQRSEWNDDDLTVNLDGAGTYTVKGFKEILTAHTSGSTLTLAQSGSRHTNEGAGATVTLILPAAADGLSYSFTRIGAQTLRIDPDGSESIRDAGGLGAGTAGEYLSLDTNGGSVELVAAGSSGIWDVVSKNGGTLSLEP